MPEHPSSSPLVSLCMPVFNEERHLAETLDGLRRQTHDNIEVLIFDNASTDRTPEICREHLSDPRFRYFRNAVNLGHIANFNRSISVAAGTYVSLRSGNDLVDPTFVEKLVAVAEADPSVGTVYARSRVIDADSKPVGSLSDEFYFETSADDPVRAGATVMERFRIASPVFGLFRRTLIERLQPFRHLHGSDAVFVCEAALYADIRCVDEELYGRRQHDRQDQLLNLHSEDFVRGLSDRSPFSRLERMMPFVDMLWGHLEMLGRAGLEEPQKAQLAEMARDIYRRRYGEQMKRELAKLGQLYDRNRRLYAEATTRLPPLMARANLLDRVKRAMVVFPGEPDLRRLATALGQAL